MALLVDLAEQAGSSDPQALAEEIDMLIEGALITRQVSLDCDVCGIARRAAETILERYLPATV